MNWAKPDNRRLTDRGLYILTINDQVSPGVYVWHADKGKFFWDGMPVALAEVGLCLSFRDLEASLPEEALHQLRTRQAKLADFLQPVVMRQAA